MDSYLHLLPFTGRGKKERIGEEKREIEGKKKQLACLTQVNTISILSIWPYSSAL